MNKSVNISLRISQQDAEFLASLELDDAVTPSEKIRKLIEQAKGTQVKKDYKAQLRQFQQLFAPLSEELKAQELNQGMHSEAMPVIIDWFIDSCSYLLDEELLDSINCEVIESEIINRIFRLFDQMLRLAITTQAPCYKPGVIRQHLTPIMELITLIQNQLKQS